MDILIRHTLNSVLRNPVQSLIAVASTAMITACILVCLCISSLFEQLAGLKAGTWYAGADLYVSALTTHAEEVADYAAALTAVFILLRALSHATSFFQVSSPPLPHPRRPLPPRQLTPSCFSFYTIRRSRSADFSPPKSRRGNLPAVVRIGCANSGTTGTGQKCQKTNFFRFLNICAPKPRQRRVPRSAPSPFAPIRSLLSGVNEQLDKAYLSTPFLFRRRNYAPLSQAFTGGAAAA